MGGGIGWLYGVREVDGGGAGMTGVVNGEGRGMGWVDEERQEGEIES